MKSRPISQPAGETHQSNPPNANDKSRAYGHALRMLGGCVLASVVFVALILAKVSDGIALAAFAVLMLGCHALMPGHHGSGGTRASGEETEPRRVEH
ncbi:MAG TPA: hypothetical protein PLH84_05930 [Candidatus Krumholzibacteria bacterium]|nr:hypothetical protein [Candidatus Krumholzibacteria bacterium]